MLQQNIPEVFIDTDVAFDIISERLPHFQQSIKIVELAFQNKIRILLSETSLANLVYLTFDVHKIPDGKSVLIDFIKTCEIKHANKATILTALDSPFKDKEDAIQYYSAIQSGADFFVTRNLKDFLKFKVNSLPVFSPIELLAHI
jgi:predicted nucleic acid-binding protein